MHTRTWAALAVLTFAAQARAGEPPSCPPIGEVEVLSRCALGRSNAVVRARLELEVLSARRVTAGQLLPSNPTLEVQLGRRVTGGEASLDRGLELGQTFELGGQRGLRLAVVDAEARGAQQVLDAAQRAVILDVYRAASTLVQARRRLEFALEEGAAAARLAEVARAREAQGVGSGLEADLAQAAQLQAGREERSGRQALREAEAKLALAIGSDTRLAERADLPELALGAVSEPELEEQAVRDRAELAVHRGQATVARAQVALLERERLPDVTLGLGLRHEELSRIVGGRLSLPLPFFRRKQGELAEQDLRVQQAESDGRNAELRARLEVRAAFADWQEARAALDTLPPGLEPRLAADVGALQSAFEKGTLPLTTVLASLREAFAARRAAAALRAEALDAALALAQASALSLPLAAEGIEAMKTLIAMMVVVGLGACAKGAVSEAAPTPGATTPAAHADEAGHDALPSQVRLTPQVIAQAGIKTAPVEEGILPRTVSLTGQLMADPDHLAMLGARVAGRVLRVSVREGDAVKAGQRVAVLTSPELARARARYVAASAQASAARQNAVRLNALVAQRLGSQQEAESAAAEATALEAERDGLAQTLRGMGAAPTVTGDPSLVSLTSPLSGEVIQRDAVPGQAVEPSHTLLTVANLSSVWFQAQLFEQDLGAVSEGAAAEVRLNGYPDQVFAARVTRLSAQVDPQTHTLTARLELTGPDRRARLGLFGTARVSRPDPGGQARLIVPRSAVTRVGEKEVVFVRHPDGDFELHEVTLGESAGGKVEVLAGLKKGEAVVVEGVHTLKSAVLRSTMSDED